jgi:leucyl/phenylalanyl-tRNA--protein transferase
MTNSPRFAPNANIQKKGRPMPVFRLGKTAAFPPPEAAHPSGLLAIGGKLEVDWLLTAYHEGIFPWFDQPPIEWWSPDPRLILAPDELKVSRSLKKTVRKASFETRMDSAFQAVIKACAATQRPRQRGTWISQQMIHAYVNLHNAGYAHSVETWCEGELVGGLYGVALGGCFFGESMFSQRNDASKVALVALVEECRKRNIALIDCQVRTAHLVSLGAREIPRAEFLALVRQLVDQPAPIGPWQSTRLTP